MTQIRLKPIDKAPGTHVLVIGVGYYRHLRGGPEPRNGNHLGLNVLKSPPLSAMYLTNWILNGNGAANSGLNNPNAPLTTLDILISSEQDEQINAAGALHTIERASLPNVRLAFDRWLEEVKRNSNSVGILYFCGHGLMGIGPEHILLLDDHGAIQNRPFETGSFDLSNTVRALWRQVSAQLYIFVDACRTYDRQVGERLNSRPSALLDDGISSEHINRGTTLIESTTEGQPAYGDSNGISRFTDALLRALSGYCGAPQTGTPNWLINGSALAQAMPKLLAMVNKERGGRAQSCTPHLSGALDAPMHTTAQIPKVKVEIELTPEVLRTISRYEIHNLVNDSLPPLMGGMSEGIWCTEANKGMY
ncbi:caspase family protein [Pectobacterium brasiliense]|nr:caspase family protein [Pectobacterium brasiliense]KFF70682.1 hypothetical protein IW00_02350 [Pectobacterium brasiliense]